MTIRSRLMTFLFVVVCSSLLLCNSLSVSVSAYTYDPYDKDKDVIFVNGDKLFNSHIGHLYRIRIYIDDVRVATVNTDAYYTFNIGEDKYCKYYDYGSEREPNETINTFYYKTYPKEEWESPAVYVNSKEYDGSPVSYSLGTGIGTMTYYFSGRNGTIYQQTKTAPSKVGDFSLYVAYSGDNTHKAWSNTYDFSITGSGEAEESKVLLTVPEHVNVAYDDTSLGTIESGKSTRVNVDAALSLTANRYFFIKLNEQIYEATNIGSSTEDYYTLDLANGISEDATIYEQSVLREDYFRVGETITLRADEYVVSDGVAKQWSYITAVEGEDFISRKLFYLNNRIEFGDLNTSIGAYNGTSPIPIGKYVVQGIGTKNDPYYFASNCIYRTASQYKMITYHNGDRVENKNRNLIVDVEIEKPITNNTNINTSYRVFSYTSPFKIEYTGVNGLGKDFSDTISSKYHEGKYIAAVRVSASIMSSIVITDISIDEENMSYILTYETNGSDKIESQIVLQSETPQKPSDPVREGYTFEGWYSDSNLTTEFDFNSVLNRNTTIYAKWALIRPLNYNIKYNWDGDNCTAVIMLEDGTTENVEMTKQADGVWTGIYNGETITARQIGIQTAEKTFTRQRNNDGTATDRAVMSISVGLDPANEVYITEIGFVVNIGNTTKTFSKNINAYASNYKLTLKMPSDKEITYYYFYEKSDGSDLVMCDAVTEYPLV